MTTRNESITADEGYGTFDEDVVDALLTELKADQGGARKTALRRALDIDASTSNETIVGSRTETRASKNASRTRRETQTPGKP